MSRDGVSVTILLGTYLYAADNIVQFSSVQSLSRV